MKSLRCRLVLVLMVGCALAGCAALPKVNHPENAPLATDRRQAIDPDSGLHATIVNDASAIPRKER